MIFKLINLFILIQLITTINCQCTKVDYEKADDSFVIITFFGRTNAVYPLDEINFNKYCETLKEHQKSLKNFMNKCLNAFSKQTIGLLLRGVNKEVKKFCSKSERNNFLIWNRCPEATKKELKQCMNNLVRESKQTMNVVSDKKLQYICCGLYNFEDCTKRRMTENQAACTKESINAFLRIIKGYTEDVKQLICGGIEPNSPKCMEAKAGFQKVMPYPIKSKSSLLPFLEITKSLGQ